MPCILAIPDESFSRAFHRDALDFQQKTRKHLKPSYMGVIAEYLLEDNFMALVSPHTPHFGLVSQLPGGRSGSKALRLRGRVITPYGVHPCPHLNVGPYTIYTTRIGLGSMRPRNWDILSWSQILPSWRRVRSYKYILLQYGRVSILLKCTAPKHP